MSVDTNTEEFMNHPEKLTHLGWAGGWRGGGGGGGVLGKFILKKKLNYEKFLKCSPNTNRGWSLIRIVV